MDSANGTILAKAELPNEDEQLTPGQFLKVSDPSSPLPAVTTIPDDAVQQGPDGT